MGNHKKPDTPVDAAYKLADKFVDAISTKHNMEAKETAELRTGIKNILIVLHNGVVEDMKETVLTDISKALHKHGYKIPKPSELNGE